MGLRGNPFTDLVSSLDAVEFETLHKAVKERIYREKIGFATFEEAAELLPARPRLPIVRGRGGQGRQHASREKAVPMPRMQQAVQLAFRHGS